MTIKKFLFHLILMAAVAGLLLVGLLFWLGSYTNHGQKLELPDYIGKTYVEVLEDAEDRSFELIIKDSIHRVGIKGGEILDQNPIPYSKVKEGRKVYVTTAKYNADIIKLEDLPSLYGKEFESKKRELSYLDITATIKGYSYDPGEPDHILEVWKGNRKVISNSGNAKGITIEKGGELAFVLSEKGGGNSEVPDLKCKQVSEAQFVLDVSNLSFGKITTVGDIADRSRAYIIDQNPAYRPGETISMGQTIDITISSTKPEYCR